MDRLWAPWRDEYMILKKKKGCIFCSAVRNTKNSADNYVVAENEFSMAMLNLYPYNNGHVLVAPKRHVRSIELLKENELLGLLKLVKRLKKRIDKTLRPAGYNIGINLGAAGGAGIPGHLHIHIVPRWQGDTNFIPVISDTKVIAYSLKKVYNLLKYADKA